jgi:hypothetical protein
MRNDFICDFLLAIEIQINMARGDQRRNSVSKGFVESVFEREGLIEFHFSIAPGERRDLFGESHESHFLFMKEIENGLYLQNKILEILEHANTLHALSLVPHTGSDDDVKQRFESEMRQE